MIIFLFADAKFYLPEKQKKDDNFVQYLISFIQI